MRVVQTYYALQNVVSGDFTYSCPAYDGGSMEFPIVLDAALITRPGRYVVIKSAAQLSDYAGATASFSSSSSLRVREVTAAGIGEPINYAGTTFYCVVVTVG